MSEILQPFSEREADFLGDIVQHGGQAVAWTAEQSFASFVANDLLIAAVERKVAIVSEACLRIDRSASEPGRFDSLFPGESIDVIRGMGNRLRHDYGGLSLRVIFDTATANLPRLITRAQQLLDG